ncbi:glycoside hydrolase family 3 protein [Acidipila sp. EB88]|nr:glycoside hydrolase family 3 protein [Acidipila sp. EB88]
MAQTPGSAAPLGSAPFKNASLPIAQRVDDLVGRMTLEEKAGQMVDEAPAIPRLDIPEYNWWNEGLHGVARSGYATMFPQAIGMAATWDRELVGQEANVIATEARAKYNRAIAEGNHGRYFGLTVWSPNINIFRDPRWGRGQETYGEDPYLTGTLGVAFVRGLQGTDARYLKVVATPKHFAVHSGPESERHKFDVTPSPYDLESTYFPAFRATIVDAKAASLMCAYNAVDGTPACANTMLLQKTLRDAWGFKGFVTSDCGAIDDMYPQSYPDHNTQKDAEHASAVSVLAGTDTSCVPTYKHLVEAVHDHLIAESAVDTAVKRLFTARMELGMFDPPAMVPYNSIPFSEDDSAAHRALAQKAASEAMVLLKNDGTLPLRSGVKTIAVVGPNAASLIALEGNYNAIPSHPVLPVDGMLQQFRNARVVYAQGSPFAEGIELPAPRTLFTTLDGKQGLLGEYYAGTEPAGTPVLKRVDAQIDFDWSHASPTPGLQRDGFTVRWSGNITAPKPGTYQFGIKVGRCGEGCGDKSAAERETERIVVTVDGKPVDTAKHTAGGDQYDSILPEIDLALADAKPHAITIEYRHLGKTTPAGISLRWVAPTATELDEAVAAARQADVTVAFVGLQSELEGEEMPVHVEGFAGGDRTALDLPAAQQKLLESVAATGKPLVVVLMNGSALAVNWAAEHANAIVEAWYPGEAGGTAIAQTLAGVQNPGGKLPLTFYANVDDLPPFNEYSMKNRTYRYFAGKPLYPFGFGLSYTHFAFTNMKLSSQSVAAGQPLTVEADLKNTGSVAGDEVAELYLTPPRTEISPRLQLIAFDRVHLNAGESRHVRFALDPRQLSTVNANGRRAMVAGQYSLALGGSQPAAGGADSNGPGLTAQFSITGEQELPK